MMNGLGTVNVELTSRCNKDCWCCGRRKREREDPSVKFSYGDMPFEMVEKIAGQLPPGIVVQLHNNGEPLLYPRFGEATRLFHRQTVSIDTNGKLLLEKAREVVDVLDTIAISVIENDPEAESQRDIIKRFLRIKGNYKPLVVLRLNGKVDRKMYEEFGVLIATRILHDPMGSFNYTKSVTIPEMGLCQDMLHHLAIDRRGNVSICVRFDPKGLGVLGNVETSSLEDLWNGAKRTRWLSLHKQGHRADVPLCAACDFWGVPTSW